MISHYCEECGVSTNISYNQDLKDIRQRLMKNLMKSQMSEPLFRVMATAYHVLFSVDAS